MWGSWRGKGRGGMRVQGGGVGPQLLRAGQTPELHTDLSIYVDKIHSGPFWESAGPKCVWEKQVARGVVQFKGQCPAGLLWAKYPW